MKAKRFLSLFTTLTMLLSLCVIAHASGSVTLELNDNGVLESSYSGENYVYDWSSSNSCVSVSDFGSSATISGDAVGTATVTCKVLSYELIEAEYDEEGNIVTPSDLKEVSVGTDTFSVTVVDNTPPEPEPVTVSISLPYLVTLSTNESDTISVSFDAGSASDVGSFDWDTSDPSVVTVSGSGSSATLRAVGAGSARVSVGAFGKDGALLDSARCEVEVTAASTPIKVTGGTSLSMTASDTKNISASVSGGSGNNYEFIWTADGQVNVFDKQRQQATVQALDAGNGTVTLTVYDPNDPSNYDETSWNVTVTSASTPLSATVSPASLALSIGENGTLTVNASGGSGNNSNYTYKWYSSSNKVTVSGNGASATVTAQGSGTATVSVDVYDNVTRQTKTVEVPVSAAGGSATYNASGSVTVGVNYPLSSIAGSIGSAFQRSFGVSVGGAASVQFSSPAGSVGVIRAASGAQVRANESITYNSMQALYFQANAAGSFTTGYTLTDGGNTLSGVVTVTASGGAAVSNMTISNSSLDMDTYSNRYISVSVSPSNAAYNVSWSSSNNSIVYVSGSGTSVTLNSQGRTGSATITATVTGTNGGRFTRSCDVYVSDSADFSLSVTLGSDYYGTSTSDSMAKLFRSTYGVTLNNRDAIIRFSSTGNSRYGVMRLANGRAISANTNYTFAEWIDMYFEPLTAGTFSLPYTLSYRGYTLSGTVDIYIRSANVSATISQTNLNLATYSNQSIGVTVSPSNVYYTVSWRSSNTNVATVSGNGLSATVKTGGTVGTATITATVTDRNGAEVYRSCSVTVSNKDAGNYSPSVSTTIGVPYRGTGTSDAMKSQFYSVYGISLPNSATIRFSSTGNNSVAVMRLKNGTAIKSNTNYTMSEYIDMYTDTVSTGVFTVPYTVDYNNKVLAGNVIVNVNGGMVNASIGITGTQPYTFSSATASGTTGSAMLGNAVTNALGGSWDRLQFGSTTGSVGTLYKDSNRTSLSGGSVRQSELGNLCFVPSGTAGDYSVSFTVLNSSGNNLANGTLYIRVATSTTPGSISFSDVKESDWYGLPVQWAVARGITNGMGRDAQGRDTFQPNATCNRAQILTFLWRAQGSPMPTISNPFSDVKSSDYFYNVALWAFEKGLVSGTSFGEKTPCTRAAAVTYMWKLAGMPGADASSFSDVPRGTETASAVDWALSKNITGGVGNDANGRPQFGPETTCTRGHIVTFLYRAYA